MNIRDDAEATQTFEEESFLDENEPPDRIPPEPWYADNPRPDRDAPFYDIQALLSDNKASNAHLEIHTIILDWKDIRAGKIDRVLSSLKSLNIHDPINADLDTLKRLRSKIAIYPCDYHIDGRLLVQIPEVRQFWQNLHAAWPYGLYFLTNRHITLLPYVMSHVEIQVERAAGSGYAVIRFPAKQVRRFLESSALPISAITSRLGESHRLEECQSNIAKLLAESNQLWNSKRRFDPSFFNSPMGEFLEYAANNDALDLIRPAELTEERLINALRFEGWTQGSTTRILMQNVIEHGHLDKLRKSVLLNVLFCRPYNGDRETLVLHFVAAAGLLRRLPNSFLNERNLFRLYDRNGRNAALIAARNGFIKQIPARLLTKKRLEEANRWDETLLTNAASGKSAIMVFDPEQHIRRKRARQKHCVKKLGRFLFQAVSSGMLGFIHKSWITEKALSVILHERKDGSQGFIGCPDTVIGAAAVHGRLHELPGRFVRQLAPSIATGHKETVLHLAAASGALNHMPRSAFNSTTVFSMLDNSGRSVAMVAAGHGCFSQIPKQVLRRGNLSARDKWGYTIFHHAIEAGWLSDIPREFFTLENLVLHSCHGDTVFHLAAANNRLNSIPGEYLCALTLGLKNNRGQTVFDCAALNGSFDHIPPRALSAEILLALDDQGETLFQRVWQKCAPTHISRSLYTREAITRPDAKGLTILDYAANREELGKIPEPALNWCGDFVLNKGIPLLDQVSEWRNKPLI